MPDVTTNNVPTLQELIARSGVDPSFYGAGGASAFGKQIGLKGKQLEGFNKFANIMKFDPSRIESLLSSIGDYGTQQRGFLQEQFDVGQESAQTGYSSGVGALRSGALGQMTGARQKTGGFAGSGAYERSFGLLRDETSRQYGGLQTNLADTMSRLTGAKQRGMAGLSERLDARVGQAQGLLGDYISRLTGLGSQYLALDPGEGEDGTFSGWNPPSNPNSGQTYTHGGKNYVWDDKLGDWMLQGDEGQKYYDQETGQWVTEDPNKFAGGGYTPVDSGGNRKG
jgi:hypothetical protein